MEYAIKVVVENEKDISDLGFLLSGLQSAFADAALSGLSFPFTYDVTNAREQHEKQPKKSEKKPKGKPKWKPGRKPGRPKKSE